MSILRANFLNCQSTKIKHISAYIRTRRRGLFGPGPDCWLANPVVHRHELTTHGGVAEWLKAHAWKACLRETVTWVRIPLPPPMRLSAIGYDHVRLVSIREHQVSRVTGAYSCLLY